MPNWGNAIWGGGNATVAAQVGVPLSSLILPAYRIAGLISRAMITPSDDMYAEAIPELARMTGTLNLSRLNIFTVRVNAFPLTASKKAYTVGPGADFDMPRPQAIQNGVIVLGNPATAGVVRYPPMSPLDDADWAQVALQDIPSGIPLAYYYDGSYDKATGYGIIYLLPQTTLSYWVEWYTWQAIPTFQTKDDMVALPPGYEDMLVYNLAARLASLNPEMANMSQDSYRTARATLAAIQRLNAPTLQVESDFEGKKGRFDFRTGLVR